MLGRTLGQVGAIGKLQSAMMLARRDIGVHPEGDGGRHRQ